MIPDYDQYLEEDKVDSLAQTIADQLRESNITELDFYTEAKPRWAPYEAALIKGTDMAGAVVVIYSLDM